MADPCEYSRPGSAPSETVNSGVNTNANAVLITACTAMSCHHGVSCVSSDRNAKHAITTMLAGTTSVFGPVRS